MVRRETPGHTGSQVPSRCNHLDAPASGATRKSPKALVFVTLLKPCHIEMSWAESPSRWLNAGIALDLSCRKVQEAPPTQPAPHPTPSLAREPGEFLRASGLLDPHPRWEERRHLPALFQARLSKKSASAVCQGNASEVSPPGRRRRLTVGIP